MNKITKLLISLLAPFIVSAASSIYTITVPGSWYQELIKPEFQPPSWLFGPVWTLLYLLMGIACYLVWTSKSKEKKAALSIYSIQLALNGLWSVMFFGIQRPDLALINIIILWILIGLNIFLFTSINKKAALLLAPYLCWVTFATILNSAIVYLN